MKMNKREVILFSLILGLVLFAIFWFLLLTPIRNELAASQLKYEELVKMDTANKAIINSVSMLEDTQKSLEDNIIELEQSLLPFLNTETITDKFVSIFNAHGMKYVTNIKTVYPEGSDDKILYPDGSFSQNSTSCIQVSLRVSGTDGVTDGGLPLVGYDQFIQAIKDIEDEDPEAIRINSIAMEDTNEGFQYFDVVINVYTFNIPHRVSTADLTHPYVIWTRPDPTLGGLIGTPYWMCLPNVLDASTTYLPFAAFTTGSVATVEQQTTQVTGDAEQTETTTAPAA